MDESFDLTDRLPHDFNISRDLSLPFKSHLGINNTTEITKTLDSDSRQRVLADANDKKRRSRHHALKKPN
jgi:hypothetical protein